MPPIRPKTLHLMPLLAPTSQSPPCEAKSSPASKQLCPSHHSPSITASLKPSPALSLPPKLQYLQKATTLTLPFCPCQNALSHQYHRASLFSLAQPTHSINTTLEVGTPALTDATVPFEPASAGTNMPSRAGGESRAGCRPVAVDVFRYITQVHGILYIKACAISLAVANSGRPRTASGGRNFSDSRSLCPMYVAGRYSCPYLAPSR